MKRTIIERRLRETITLFVIVLLFILINVRWIWLFRRDQPLDIDEAGYLAISLVDFHTLMSDGVMGWLKAVESPNTAAPVTTALSSISYIVLGPKALAGFATPILAGVVTITASYFLGTSMNGRRLGLLTSILVGTSPIVINYARSYIFALPATAVTTVALLALVRSDGFSNAKWALIFGLCLGLMPLTRTMTIAFVPALVLAAVVQAISETDDRRRRIIVLALSLVLAIATAATWLIPNGSLVLQYLADFGYGPRSVEYGPEQSLFDPGTWLLTIQYLAFHVHLPDLVLLTAGLFLLIVEVGRLIHIRGWRVTGRLVIRAKLFPAVLFVAASVVVLTSSRNRGSAFIAPLVPAMIVIAVWGLVRFGQSRSWERVITGFTIPIAIISCLPLLDLTIPEARPWAVRVPFLGPTIVTDGRGTIQKYEAAGGYSSDNPAIPVDPLTGRAWVRVSEMTARRLDEIAGGGVVTAFGLRGYLYNVNTVNLAQLLSGRSQLALTQIAPVATGESIDGYAEWLISGDAATARFLLSASGTIGEMRPVINQEYMEAAAGIGRFSPGDQWPLPDGRVVTIWSRDFAAGNCGARISPLQMSETGGDNVSVATFDSWATLERYSYEPVKDGVALHLRWRAVEPLTADILVAIHLIDEKGNILAQDDYARAKSIPAGDTADDCVFIPRPQLNATVHGVAIGLYMKEGTMAPIDRGFRDWDGHRLLLPPPG